MHYKIMFAAVCALLIGHSALAAAQVSLSLGDVSAPVGGVVAMPLSLDAPDGGAASLVLKLTFDTAQLSLVELSLAEGVTALGKGEEHRSANGEFNLSIFGGVETFSTGALGTLYWKLNPSVEIGTVVNVGFGESSAASPAAEAVAVQGGGGAISVTTLSGNHSADYQKNWAVSLSELLRVIQFFNSDALHCDPLSEDGYNPGAGDTACGNHDSDYNLADWKINLSELLRIVQFYNSTGSAYHPDANGEDGFAPGPFGG